MSERIITIDRFFSIWIFFYTIIYLLKIAPYNPVILISIALIFFITSLFIIIPRLNESSLLIYYISINIIGKIIPLILIINHKITTKDIIFTVLFILIYVAYMFIINEDIVYIYTEYIEFIIDRDKASEGAIYHVVDKIFTNIF